MVLLLALCPYKKSSGIALLFHVLIALDPRKQKSRNALLFALNPSTVWEPSKEKDGTPYRLGLKGAKLGWLLWWFHRSDVSRPPVQEGKHQRSFALVGLHSCGDLVPTMLRVFGETPQVCTYMSWPFPTHAGKWRYLTHFPTHWQVTSVYAVSCCYMKLKTGSKPDVGEGQGGCSHSETPYPLSRFVNQLGMPLGNPESPMGFHMREQACHSIDSYSAKVLEADSAPPRKGYPGFLHNHCYRAILELMVKNLGQSAPRDKLGKASDETAEGSLCRWVWV